MILRQILVVMIQIQIVAQIQYKLHLKKGHPNPAFMGEVKNFSNKKELVRRMTMIHSALDRSLPNASDALSLDSIETFPAILHLKVENFRKNTQRA